MPEFKRRFQLWSYEVGHGTLLLRSPKGESETRVDLLFKDVAVLHLPTTMSTLRISVTSPASLQFDDSLLESRVAYRVHSPELDGYVVAGSLSKAEDAKEYGDASSPFELMDLEP